MSARLRSTLHPLTVASIDMQSDCGCTDYDAARLWLCPYHQGYQDGIDALEQQGVKSDG